MCRLVQARLVKYTSLFHSKENVGATHLSLITNNGIKSTHIYKRFTV